MDKRTEATLKIYGDEMSQPVRSVLLFCEFNKIPYNYIKISLAKGEQYVHEELKKVNPNKKVPAISYSDSNIKDFYLSESCAILRFLADTYKVPEHWYNRVNTFRRAKIEELLDWHHFNTRYICYYAIVKELMAPNMLKMGGELAERAKSLPDTGKYVPGLLKKFEKIFSKQNYAVDNEISIVDLIYTQEIDQIRVLGYNLKEYENLWRYIQRVNGTEEGIKFNKVTERMVNKANDHRRKKKIESEKGKAKF